MLSNLSIRYHIPVVLGKTIPVALCFFEGSLAASDSADRGSPKCIEEDKVPEESGEAGIMFFHPSQGTTPCGDELYSLKA